MRRFTLEGMQVRLLSQKEFTTNLNIFKFHNVADMYVNDIAHLNISEKSKMIIPSSLFFKDQEQ